MVSSAFTSLETDHVIIVFQICCRATVEMLHLLAHNGDEQMTESFFHA